MMLYINSSNIQYHACRNSKPVKLLSFFFPIQPAIMKYSTVALTALVAVIMLSFVQVQYAQKVCSITNWSYDIIQLNMYYACMLMIFQTTGPTCPTNYNLVEQNGDCICKCRSTNDCNSIRQVWDAEECRCVCAKDLPYCLTGRYTGFDCLCLASLP